MKVLIIDIEDIEEHFTCAHDFSGAYLHVVFVSVQFITSCVDFALAHS